MVKVVTAFGLTLLLWPVHAASDTAERPDLSGRWTLNRAMSEDALEKMRDLAEKNRNRGGGFGGPPAGTGRGGGAGGTLGGGFGGSGHGRRVQRAGPMATINQGIDAIEIAQTGDQLSFTYSDDRLRILLADGRKDKRASPWGDTATTARWTKKGELSVRTKGRNGKIEETYRLDPRSGRLLVDITVDSRIGSITFFRTYDPASPSETEAEAVDPG